MKKPGRIILVFIVLLLFAFAIVGCGDADISDYENKQILVTGLGDDFYITPKELKEMECVSATAVGQTEKAGKVKGYGPTLKTFVESRGYTLQDLKSARFIASDDYAVTLGKVTWNKYDVILSIAQGGKPLYETQRPLRLVIPGGKSGNWVYGIVEIDFALNKE